MIAINYGTDWQKTAYETLAASDIGQCLRPGMAVSIKPNLVLPSPPSQGATTHPEVVEGIVRFLRDFGIRKIKVMESSAAGYCTKKAFKVCGYEELAKKCGIELVDLKNAPARTLRHGVPGEFVEISVAEAALGADFLLNVPVLKAHCQTRLTCCMKNLKGCIPESEMRRFHALGLHGPIAALAALLPVHYNVIDGICGDLSFEEGGSPVEADRIMAGRDPVLLDSYCAGIIGYSPDDIGYLALARENGLGEFFSPETPVLELNAERKPARQSRGARLSERYQGAIAEDCACSVCYASLIHALHRAGGSGRKICIGQGFKKKPGPPGALGIGSCASGFAEHVPGCPPRAADIIKHMGAQPMPANKSPNESL